ncbi:MAG: hypothetical protein QF464_08425, partial [Myxococcota bacterium]|nr:hypothetical protein [Myxococcota bacterium]
AITLHWATTSGGPAHYTRLNVSAEKYGPTFWTIIVDGSQTSAVLPDLTQEAGLAGLGSGSRAIELQRVRNHAFDINDYISRQFGTYHRAAWSIERAEFYAP